jgi:DNA-binding XRE family transcriptional regulator
MGKRVNQAELAEILGVSHTTLWNWGKEGIPIDVEGDSGLSHEYDTAKVIAWQIAREVAKAGKPKTVRDQLAEVELELKQLDLGERKEILVPTSEVEPAWKMRVLSSAAFLMGAPSRLAGILEATDGVEAKRQVLKQEFAAFLTKLSGADGERMQKEVEDLLEKVSGVEAEAFLRRIAGYDDQQNATRPGHPSVGDAGAAGQDPALGVG